MADEKWKPKTLASKILIDNKLAFEVFQKWPELLSVREKLRINNHTYEKCIVSQALIEEIEENKKLTGALAWALDTLEKHEHYTQNINFIKADNILTEVLNPKEG